MFTGIVEEMGRIVESTSTRFAIEANLTLAGTSLGDSIAVNGACLTIVNMYHGIMEVDVTPETFRCTNLSDIKAGDPVNLERAMAMGGRLGGHMVQGHIEATGTVAAMDPDGESIVIEFRAPKEVMRYIVNKGFIAVDGISLTVVEQHPSSFTTSVIPYTRMHSVLGYRRIGDRVNLETDVIARYVERLMNCEK
ncbi:riboflavin synthase [Dehalococcoidia bacterium]|nr:riboflavin synthase [Dehalococcoidia bacterium]